MKEINLNDYDWENLNDYPNVGISSDGSYQELSFNGNSLLRPYNSKLILSKKAKEEREKCSNDFFYFVKNYCLILTLKEGVINIKLRDYQKEFLNLVEHNRFIISSQSRRAGKTTTISLFIVWNVCFKKDYIAGISANRIELTTEIVSMVKTIYELLPPFLQSGIKKWNAKSVELSNGSKVKSSVMSANSFRGLALSFLLIDECAWIDTDKYNAFEDSVMPTISTSDKTKVVKISTPNGLNHFYKDVQEAKANQNGYKFFEVTWRDIDFYTEEWAEEEIKRIGIAKFNQNYACLFLGSSSTLLSAETLKDLIKEEPLIEDIPYDGIKLYRNYNSNCKYLITVDTSKTVGKLDPENDYIAVIVWEMNNTIQQSLVYRTNTLHYTELSGVLVEIGRMYDYPLIVIENNEGSGQATADRLHDSEEYPNVYFDPSKEGEIAGVRTTKSNRPVALKTIKKLIEMGIMKIVDSSTIDEFNTFIKVGKRYEAQTKSTDDCVMSTALVSYILMDLENDLEVTIDDYLERKVEEVEGSDDQDVDFVGHVDSFEEESKDWLYP